MNTIIWYNILSLFIRQFHKFSQNICVASLELVVLIWTVSLRITLTAAESYSH